MTGDPVNRDENSLDKIEPDFRVFDSEFFMEQRAKEDKRRMMEEECSSVPVWDKHSLSILREFSVQDVAEWVAVKVSLDPTCSLPSVTCMALE